MRDRMKVALGAACFLMGLPVMAEAADTAVPHARRLQRLPPVSGTIRLAPGGFGQGGRHTPAVQTASSGYGAPSGVQVIRGPGWRDYSADPYGGQGLAARRLSYQALTPAERWATGGTGLVGLIGNTGNPFAGAATWGTADSATTGSAYQTSFGDRGGRYGAERPLAVRYGEPQLLPQEVYREPSYGAAPQLGYYASGAPSSLPYYSSGSSAGPYGSPGGLAVYRSGSYGVGPRIIVLGSRYGRTSSRCSCGPRIVRLSHQRRGHLVSR